MYPSEIQCLIELIWLATIFNLFSLETANIANYVYNKKQSSN